MRIHAAAACGYPAALQSSRMSSPSIDGCGVFNSSSGEALRIHRHTEINSSSESYPSTFLVPINGAQYLAYPILPANGSMIVEYRGSGYRLAESALEPKYLKGVGMGDVVMLVMVESSTKSKSLCQSRKIDFHFEKSISEIKRQISIFILKSLFLK